MRATSDLGRAAAPTTISWGPLGVVSGLVTAVLVAVSGGYGYHRDELYFLESARHLAFGYVDNPPLTPVLAWVATGLFGDSLVGLRLLPALAAGLVTLLTGLMAREFGGGRGPQLLAAACMGVSSILLAVGHQLSTTTFDILAWAAVSLLAVRAVRLGGPAWLWVGLAAGLGLQNKTLVAFLLVALAIGLALAGPRRELRRPWLWGAAGIAAVLWTPNLLWQAANGWPLLELSSAIAEGGSGTSEPWWMFLPYQLVLIGLLLVPVWAVGLWRLGTAPELRNHRAFAVAYPLLAAVFMATGGKPYYVAGLYPVLLAAGAEPVLHWARAGRSSARRMLLATAIVVSAAFNATLMLPLVPVQYLATTPIVDINYDAGEAVGWPRLVETVAAVHAALPEHERAGAVVLAGDYGLAGAVDRFGADAGLPRAYSGHNSYADWGPPPEHAGPTIVIGYERSDLEQWFGDVDAAATVDNGVGLDNDAQGAPVWLCRNRLVSWAQLWPQLRHVG